MRPVGTKQQPIILRVACCEHTLLFQDSYTKAE